MNMQVQRFTFLIAIATLFCASFGAMRAAAADCPAASTPVISLTYGSRYAEFDAQRATLDLFQDAAVDAALAPLETFLEDLADRAGRMYQAPPHQSVSIAECILDHLQAWAKAGALTKLGSETTQLTIGSRIAGLSLIVWQAAAYAPHHPGRAKILSWLENLQQRQIDFWRDAPSGARVGNLRVWAALAAAALSAQIDRPDFSEWSRASLKDVMCTATPSGSLPQEMSRGRYALHYQLHAVAPMVTSVALLEQQAIPARTLCDNALHRIVAFTVSDLITGSKTKAIAGVDQSLTDATSQLQSFQLAWLEPYLLLVPSAELNAALQPLRPLTYSKLGGNQTELWAR